MTRRELFARFDSVDLSYEWVLHTKLFPLPNPSRESAQIAAFVANYNKLGGDWINTEDLMPIDQPDEETQHVEQPPDEQKLYASLVHTLLGG